MSAGQRRFSRSSLAPRREVVVVFFPLVLSSAKEWENEREGKGRPKIRPHIWGQIARCLTGNSLFSLLQLLRGVRACLTRDLHRFPSIGSSIQFGIILCQKLLQLAASLANAADVLRNHH